MWRLLSVCALLMCAACSLSPTSEDAAAFGKAATAAVTMVKDARTVEIDLDRQRSVERHACRYLQDGTIVLAALPDGKPTPSLAPQLELLNAILEYSEALSKATDPKVFAELEAAVGKLPGAATAAAGAFPNAAVSPIFGPVLQVISTVAIDVIELQMRARLRDVIQHTDPFLRTAAARLLEDLDPVKKNMLRKYNEWTARKQCNLIAMRNHAQTPRSDLYANFKEADAEARTFQARLAILKNSDMILLGLQETHYAMLSDEIKIEEGLERLTKYLKELKALKDAIEGSAKG